MTRLNQIIAVEKGAKSKAHQEFTDAHHIVQRAQLLSGLTRNYQVKDEENGETLPHESTQVQIKVEEVLRFVAGSLTRLMDLTATKDWANCLAKANIVVDGDVLLKDVPVTHLLFLEKQLVDLNTFVKKLPVLDPAESWTHDPSSDTWKTAPVQTVKTKKIPRTLVKYEATEKHPAQVDVWNDDVLVGYWTTVKFSGALPQQRVNQLMQRITTLTEAVKHAREEANMTVVTDQNVGELVFGHLFG